MLAAAQELVNRYFNALNERDSRACLALLSDDVILDVNQGGREQGRAAFAAYLERSQRSYRETAEDLVIMAEQKGRHAACEYTLAGEYLLTEDGLPEACGQPYRLSAGAFFEIRDGLICRVSQHFNLPEWLAQVDDY